MSTTLQVHTADPEMAKLVAAFLARGGQVQTRRAPGAPKVKVIRSIRDS